MSREFRVECTAAPRGQKNLSMTLSEDGRALAALDYIVVDNGAVYLSYIEVAESERRRGLATALLQELQQQHPGTELQLFGNFLSPAGAAWWASLPVELVDSPQAGEFRELATLREQFKHLEQALMEASFDDPRWASYNEQQDRLYLLECELRGCQASLRLILPAQQEQVLAW